MPFAEFILYPAKIMQIVERAIENRVLSGRRTPSCKTFASPPQTVMTTYSKWAASRTTFFIIGIQYCYSAEAGLHHFCAALAVACKFRLCLQPGGLLRVQSLHLPAMRAWLGVVCKNYRFIFSPTQTAVLRNVDIAVPTHIHPLSACIACN